MAKSNDHVSDDLLIRGIHTYSGIEVEKLRREPDPEVDGAMALHATMVNGSYLQFFISAHAPELRTPDNVADALEECDFEQWPPKTGALRFF